MSTPRNRHVEELMALSGNEDLVAARQRLLKDLDDNATHAVAQCLVEQLLSRSTREKFICVVLDMVMKGRPKQAARTKVAASSFPDLAAPIPGGTAQIIDLDPDFVPSDDDNESDLTKEASHETASQEQTTTWIRPCGLSLGFRLYCVKGKVGAQTAPRYRMLSGYQHVLDVLKEKFVTDFESTEERWRRVETIRGEIERYVDEHQCLDKRIESETRGTDCTYGESDWQMGYACDRCISRKRLCGKPANVKGKVQLVIYPLPDKLRVGVDWLDKEYWVLP